MLAVWSCGCDAAKGAKGVYSVGNSNNNDDDERESNGVRPR